MSSILLVRHGGLGDLLTTLPSVSLVRRFRPAWKLTLACRKEYGVLLKESGLVDETMDSGSREFMKTFSGTASSEENGEKRRFSGFDLVIGWMQNAQTKSDHDQFFLKSGVRKVHLTAFDRPDMAVSQFFFGKTAEFLAEDVSIPEYSPKASGGGSLFGACSRLPIPDSWKKEGRRIRAEDPAAQGTGYAVVHPGSGSRVKRWPLDRFVDAAATLAARGMPGIFVSGEAEEEDLAMKLDGLRLPRGWIWSRTPGIRAIAGLLVEASLYLGNDSGVTHLAAACGCFGVAVFRKELEGNWTPAGDIAVVSSEDVGEISLDAVLERLRMRCKSL